MYPTKLAPLLADGVFGPNLVRDISDICDEWYENEASLISFVFRSIFRDLLFRGWDNPQGVSTAEFTQFTTDALPRMRTALTATPTALNQLLTDVAIAYHSSI